MEPVIIIIIFNIIPVYHLLVYPTIGQFVRDSQLQLLNEYYLALRMQSLTNMLTELSKSFQVAG